jgi:hypothetical protein
VGNSTPLDNQRKYFILDIRRVKYYLTYYLTDEPLRNLEKSTHLIARLNAEVD